MEQQAGDGETAVEHSEIVNAAIYYHDTGTDTLTARPAIGAMGDKAEIEPTGADVLTISNIPDDALCTIFWNRADQEVEVDEFNFDDSSGVHPDLEVTVDTVGHYRMFIELFPYLSESFEFDAAEGT
jgi:hypothetical protein